MESILEWVDSKSTKVESKTATFLLSTHLRTSTQCIHRSRDWFLEVYLRIPCFFRKKNTWHLRFDSELLFCQKNLTHTSDGCFRSNWRVLNLSFKFLVIELDFSDAPSCNRHECQKRNPPIHLCLTRTVVRIPLMIVRKNICKPSVAWVNHVSIDADTRRSSRGIGSNPASQSNTAWSLLEVKANSCAWTEVSPLPPNIPWKSLNLFQLVLELRFTFS